MSAFAQTPQGGLDISTGNLRVVKDVPTVTAAKLSNLFGFFKGEWFLDTRQGIPYVQYVLVKTPNLPLIASIFARVVNYCPGVAALLELSLNYDPRARTLAPKMKVAVNGGAVLVGGVGQAFIIAAQSAGNTGGQTS